MDSVYEPISWAVVSAAVLQTLMLFGFVFVMVRIIGRRLLAELGNQELVGLVFIAQICNGLLHQQEMNHVGLIASLVTLMIMSILVQWMPVGLTLSLPVFNRVKR